MKTATNVEVEVTPRTIYAFGKRKARVFDARLGAFSATKSSKKEAVAAVLADKAYVETAGRLQGHRCELYAQGVGEWCFVLPSGGSMCFGAADLSAAFARVRSDYADHEDCAAFFREVRP